RVAAVERGQIHVYGRDATIREIRAQARPGVLVHGHGTGMGIAWITQAASLEAEARALADDVVVFDQRGCMSPRGVLVEGDESRAAALGRAIDSALADAARRVPRGVLAEDERAEAEQWLDTMVFGGTVWRGPEHAVAVAPEGAPLLVPPPGRHVLVA